jgi:phytoene synthase
MSADGDLDETVRRVDPERWLASRFVADRAPRADVISLLAFDHELSRAGVVASNSLIAEIRLTWWREALDEIFTGRPVRRHPVSIGLASLVKRRGLDRGPLEAMIDARIDNLDHSRLDFAAALRWADGAPGSVAMLAARILDPEGPWEAARLAGRAWGLRALGHSFGAALSEASRAARILRPVAFPAVAHATLLRAHSTSPLEARLRLMWAVARGKI